MVCGEALCGKPSLLECGRPHGEVGVEGDGLKGTRIDLHLALSPDASRWRAAWRVPMAISQQRHTTTLSRSRARRLLLPNTRPPRSLPPTSGEEREGTNWRERRCGQEGSSSSASLPMRSLHCSRRRRGEGGGVRRARVAAISSLPSLAAKPQSLPRREAKAEPREPAAASAPPSSHRQGAADELPPTLSPPSPVPSPSLA